MMSCFKCSLRTFPRRTSYIRHALCLSRSSVVNARLNSNNCSNEEDVVLQPSLRNRNRITKPVAARKPLRLGRETGRRHSPDQGSSGWYGDSHQRNIDQGSDLLELDEDLGRRVTPRYGGRSRGHDIDERLKTGQRKSGSRYERESNNYSGYRHNDDAQNGNIGNWTERGCRNFVNHQSSNPQGYNYNLPGKGKKRSIQKTRVSGGNEDILFGLYPVLLALHANRRSFSELLVKPSLLDAPKPLVTQLIALADQREVPVLPTGVNELYDLSQARPHQGVCLRASKLHYQDVADNVTEISEESHTASSQPQVWLVLDSIQDPMNFGAVLRSAYFLGVERVCTVKGDSCPLSPVVSKASAGAMEITDIFEINSLPNFLQDQRDKGWHILGTAADRGLKEDEKMEEREKVVSLEDVQLTQDTVLILGNEGVGLSSNTATLCDHLLTIKPRQALHPYMDSLNVSVATGIILHHLLAFRSRGS